MAGSSDRSTLGYTGILAGVSFTAEEEDGRARRKSFVELLRTVPGITDALEGGITDASNGPPGSSVAKASRKRLLTGVALT